MLQSIVTNKQARHQVKRQIMYPTCNNHLPLGKQLHYAINRVEFFKVIRMKIGKNEPRINNTKQGDNNPNDEMIAAQPKWHPNKNNPSQHGDGIADLKYRGR